jgi:type VI secretion system secreted protein VgrG
MPRTFTLHSALDDQLKFRRLTGHEALSEVSEFNIDVASPSPNIAATDLLGTNMTVEIITQTGDSRYLDGICTGFVFIGPDSSASKQYLYKARVNSWLYLATKTADCCIHQQKDAKTIIQDTLSPLGMPMEFKLSGSYPTQEYVVRYNETALAFAMRIAEEAGIYWYVRHDLGEHTVVFTDGSNPTMPDYEEITFLTPSTRPMEADEYISELHFANELKSGRYVTRSFNFEHPTANLEQVQSLAKGHSNDSLEMFEWTGNYMERGEGGELATIHREQQQLDYQTISGSSNVRGMAPGYKFTLTDHPRDEANTEYLVLGAIYAFQENSDSARSNGAMTSWDISFKMLPSSDRYYPPRVTKKPVVTGPHSALVTGPAGQEIWCDEYARIKLHFYWDRYSKKDENSSKWIRVSSSWAGSNFGAIQIPRIGQEVLVDYLNGDISMPVVIGRVYNKDNMPPWDLPANATQSGILSRSSTKGQYSNANALRFEDKKGHEQVWMQAEKDMLTVVEANDTQSVGANRVITVGGAHSETITKDTAITVTEGNHSTTIAKGCHTTTVSQGDQSNVVSTGSQTNTVKGDITVSSESGEYKLSSPTKITLAVGGSTIIIEPDHITITSAKIDLNP